MSRHDRVNRLLPWHHNGTLSPEDQYMVQQHLDNCERCQRQLREISTLQDELDAGHDPANVDAAQSRFTQLLFSDAADKVDEMTN